MNCPVDCGHFGIVDILRLGGEDERNIKWIYPRRSYYLARKG